MLNKIKMKIQSKYVLAIVPARKGSLRLKNKHIKKIGKKKLIDFTFDAIKKSKKITKTILLSNDEKVIKIAKKKNFIEIYNRPKQISKSTSPSREYVKFAIEKFLSRNYFIPEYILILQPTTPFRDYKDIDRSIGIIYKKKINSLISVTEPIQDPSECIYINKKKKFPKYIYQKYKTIILKEISNQELKLFLLTAQYFYLKRLFFLKKTFFLIRILN